jgi:hypothetical protein
MNYIRGALKNPFRTYFKIGSYSFGLTFLSNLGTGVFEPNPNFNLYESPQAFIFSNFAKSCFFGFLWPSVPFVLVKNPKDYFLLGHSFGRCFKDEENKSDKE